MPGDDIVPDADTVDRLTGRAALRRPSQAGALNRLDVAHFTCAAGMNDRTRGSHGVVLVAATALDGCGDGGMVFRGCVRFGKVRYASADISGDDAQPA